MTHRATEQHYAEEWRRSILNAGADDHAAERAVELAKLNGLFEPYAEVERLRAEVGGLNLANRAALREVDRLHNDLEPKIARLRAEGTMLAQAILEAIEAIERGSTSAPVSECLKAALSKLNVPEQETTK